MMFKLQLHVIPTKMNASKFIVNASGLSMKWDACSGIFSVVAMCAVLI